eukprot:403331386
MVEQSQNSSHLDLSINPNYVQANLGSPQVPEANSQRREIGDLAVWTLSSAKPGNGVEQIRDDQVSTFWQSDGTQPHYVNIQFLKKMRVQEISLYLDFKTDESYTPSKISIRVGNSFYELQEVKLIEFEEPIGWFTFQLHEKGTNGQILKPYIKTMFVQIAILQNQHSGRDTHIRQIKIFAPREKQYHNRDMHPNFLTTEMTQFSTIR